MTRSTKITDELPRPHSLVSLAHSKLQALIFNGHILAGQKLKESVIADQIGFSRGPVREASQMLVSEGFLLAISQRGLFVRDFSADEIDDLYQIRGHLSLLVGRLAAENRDKSAIDRLRETHARMQDAVNVQADESYFEITQQFNDTVLETAKNDELAKIYRRVVRSIRLYRVQFLDPLRRTGERHTWLADSYREAIDQRGKFLEALEKGDGELSGIQLNRHSEDSRERTAALVGAFRNLERNAKPI
jgi:DNA-binding GntR family transcriptional regulator